MVIGKEIKSASGHLIVWTNKNEQGQVVCYKKGCDTVLDWISMEKVEWVEEFKDDLGKPILQPKNKNYKIVLWENKIVPICNLHFELKILEEEESK